MFKKLTLLLTIIFIMSTNIVSVYAESEGVDTSLHNEVPSYAESNDGNYVDLAESNDEQARTIERYIYRKKNVKNTTMWGAPVRVSENIDTTNSTSSGGSISCNKSVTYKGSVSGDVFGIKVDFGGSISSSVGYTLNVKPNSIVYMTFKVQYAVEEGTREKFDTITQKVVATNSYRVKKPVTGTYALANA